MNFFDQVRQWPPVTEELRLYVELVYGRPTDTPQYLNRLPAPVVQMAYAQFMSNGASPRFPPDVEGQRAILGFMLNGALPTAADTINECLYRYHQLTG